MDRASRQAQLLQLVPLWVLQQCLCFRKVKSKMRETRSSTKLGKEREDTSKGKCSMRQPPTIKSVTTPSRKNDQCNCTSTRTMRWSRKLITRTTKTTSTKAVIVVKAIRSLTPKMLIALRGSSIHFKTNKMSSVRLQSTLEMRNTIMASLRLQEISSMETLRLRMQNCLSRTSKRQSKGNSRNQ